MRKSAFIAAVSALALTLPATSVLAEGHTWQVGNHAFHIYFTDLNLHSASGRAVALARVEKAAARLCEDAGVRSDAAACEAKTIQSVMTGSMGDTLNLALAERAGPVRELASTK